MRILLVLLILTGTGCQNLNRILNGAESYPPEPIVYNNPHIVRGVTIVDYQAVQPIPITNRTLTVKVKERGQSDFRTLNPYEYALSNKGTPTLSFQHRVFIEGGRIRIPYPKQPVAPTGTEFIIISRQSS